MRMEEDRWPKDMCVDRARYSEKRMTKEPVERRHSASHDQSRNGPRCCTRPSKVAFGDGRQQTAVLNRPTMSLR
jgi:hypothetical protein